MTTLREAAQQALEALEAFLSDELRPYEAAKISAALRAVLAQQDEPVQEPVAYFGSAYVNENGVHITTVLGPVAIPQDAKLYTAPPQRLPLTEEEIDKIFKHLCNTVGASCKTMARAVERAHGIKE